MAVELYEIDQNEKLMIQYLMIAHDTISDEKIVSLLCVNIQKRWAKVYVKLSNMGVLKEFLEKSTIHGLSFISDAKSFGEKVFWAIVVTMSFGFSAFLIGSSYSEWMESPVSTVVTTKPISELEFPEVTVCPPKSSNTALNLVLERVINDEKTAKSLGTRLHEKINKILTGQPRKFGSDMAKILNIPSLNDIQDGKIKFPEKTEDAILYQLNISTMESLTIRAEEGRKWNYSWQKDKLKLYREAGKMTFADAEAFCVSLGGHLASIVSEKENVEALKIAEQPWEWTWLGGTDQEERGLWVWNDGRVWNFTDWAFSEPNNESKSRCMCTIGFNWYATSCSEQLYPLCHVTPKTTNGTLQVDLSEKERKVLHIWLQYNISDPQYFENSSLKMNISWTEQKGATDKKKIVKIEGQRLNLQHFYQKVSWAEAGKLCQQIMSTKGGSPCIKSFKTGAERIRRSGWK